MTDVKLYKFPRTESTKDEYVIFDKTGSYRWYKGDKLHKEDGPAVVMTDESEKWYKDGKLHRENGPAVIEPNIKKWYLCGKLHRSGFPAVIRGSGKDSIYEWYLDGVKVDIEELEKEYEEY